jgi:hypothetical protein
MNRADVIRLAKEAGIQVTDGNSFADDLYISVLYRFANLVVRECANIVENRAPGQMGKEGEGWTNGYDEGLKTGAFLIKKHFGGGV